jgi:hypothetical protein
LHPAIQCLKTPFFEVAWVGRAADANSSSHAARGNVFVNFIGVRVLD